MAKIIKNAPVTSAEELLSEIAENTFLSMWSYPSVFRNTAGGKEICDLLVIFGNDIVIFSDKDCEYPTGEDPGVNWSRWFKRSITKSLKQIYGAERWLLEHPDRVYLDAECTMHFPIEIPEPDKARIHRVAVVHDIRKICREQGLEHGMLVNTKIKGIENHIKPPYFSIGKVFDKKGYVHVFDVSSLAIAMQMLDTVSDFVGYLSKKERFIETQGDIFAPSEQDLIAVYMQNLGDDGEHAFPECNSMMVEQGLWYEFVNGEDYASKVESDQISYLWDSLIEQFAIHVLGDTQHYATEPKFESGERILRILASENRVRRRMLSHALRYAMLKVDQSDWRFARVVGPKEGEEGVFYGILILAVPPNVEYETYREVRKDMLYGLCLAIRRSLPHAKDIVGLGFDPPGGNGMSEDAIYFDGSAWNTELENEEAEYFERYQLLAKPSPRNVTANEYPRQVIRNTKVGRNAPCPCGSGRKYKKCCIRKY